jgi:hypothetical protein
MATPISGSASVTLAGDSAYTLGFPLAGSAAVTPTGSHTKYVTRNLAGGVSVNLSGAHTKLCSYNHAGGVSVNLSGAHTKLCSYNHAGGVSLVFTHPSSFEGGDQYELHHTIDTLGTPLRFGVTSSRYWPRGQTGIVTSYSTRGGFSAGMDRESFAGAKKRLIQSSSYDYKDEVR